MTDHHTTPAFGSSTEAGIVTVHCSGDLDLACAPRMRAALLAPIRDGAPGVVADLTATTFCDSTIFSVLVELHRAAVARGVSYSIAADPVAVARPLEILGLDRLLPLHDDLGEARAAVAEHQESRVS
ncbi:STAS domain-containing protein [Amycolatopsis sp. NPDC088138]|uniref:STAS domain-containing protein n=1 Tax=Amycolatopsis sp. NPDC088138 TaxID=3363938 RepID=UPI003808FD6F